MRQSLSLLLPLALVLLLGACSESVDPFLESDRQFTLYGTLDMSRDTQFVRVVPVRQTLDPGPATPLDAVFRSTELASGRQTTWRDSVVTFDDGTFGHVYYAPLRLRPGHTYRLEVHWPGSELVTRAETTVPAPLATVFPEIVVGGTSTLGSGSQRIVWSGIHRQPFQVEMWYRFIADHRLPFVDVMLPEPPPAVLDGSGGLTIDLDLRKDRLTLDTLISVYEMPLAGLGLRITMLDAAFVPPGGVFDPEVLVQPGSMENVENGFGFVGSIGRYTVEWTLRDSSAEVLNYASPSGIFGADALVPGDGSPRPARPVYRQPGE